MVRGLLGSGALLPFCLFQWLGVHDLLAISMDCVKGKFSYPTAEEQDVAGSDSQICGESRRTVNPRAECLAWFILEYENCCNSF